MHPYETVFLKASWHVGEPHLSEYTRWFLSSAEGNSGTEGSYDEQMYFFAIDQARANHPHNVTECFSVKP